MGLDSRRFEFEDGADQSRAVSGPTGSPSSPRRSQTISTVLRPGSCEALGAVTWLIGTSPFRFVVRYSSSARHRYQLATLR